MKNTIALASLVAVLASLTTGCTTDYPSLASIESNNTALSISTKRLSEPPQTEPAHHQATAASFTSTAAEPREPVFKTLSENEDIMAHINGAPGVVLIDFFADWCGPCRKQSEILKQLKKSAAKKNVSIIKINVDDRADLASKFKISALPTLIVVKDQKIIERKTGLTSKSKMEAFISR